ncbi:hypothetical protein ED733_004685 [Metarhizium rileyi]|uniref:Nudix hydrolase domain-containing protein n=1 Tax=Metarhizium rileyi (strain RCEF 4871) TaxID=1649241 RepID=A0A5C6GHK5_METRR|nr:hypothetical protein ED733_004685 [Metarhizium rileyi]
MSGITDKVGVTEDDKRMILQRQAREVALPCGRIVWLDSDELKSHKRAPEFTGVRTGSHGAGTLTLPGGHHDPGETIEQCGERETREETGIKARRVEVFGKTYDNFATNQGGLRHYITYYSQVFKEDLQAKPEISEEEKKKILGLIDLSPNDLELLYELAPHMLFLPLKHLFEIMPNWALECVQRETGKEFAPTNLGGAFGSERERKLKDLKSILSKFRDIIEKSGDRASTDLFQPFVKNVDKLEAIIRELESEPLDASREGGQSQRLRSLRRTTRYRELGRFFGSSD